jgi:hypothetical protein
MFRGRVLHTAASRFSSTWGGEPKFTWGLPTFTRVLLVFSYMWGFATSLTWFLPTFSRTQKHVVEINQIIRYTLYVSQNIPCKKNYKAVKGFINITRTVKYFTQTDNYISHIVVKHRFFKSPLSQSRRLCVVTRTSIGPRQNVARKSRNDHRPKEAA